MKRFYFLRFSKLAAILLIALFALPLLALAQGGLVPCTGPTCNFCHLFVLARNIMKFLILTLAMPIAALLFAWAGILYITAAGNTGQIGRAKKIFADVLLGLVIAVAAALIVDLILRTFTGNDLKFWTRYDPTRCEAAAPGGEVVTATATEGQPPPPPPPPPPGGDEFQQNQDTLTLLSTFPAVQWLGAVGDSCAGLDGKKVSALTNKAELSAKAPLTVCYSGCSTSPVACKPGTGTLNPSALGALTFLAQEGTGFTITSISTGSHSKTSQHYALRAVDISTSAGNYPALLAKLQSIPAVSDAFCENKSGKIGCTDASVNHIHFEVQ